MDIQNGAVLIRINIFELDKLYSSLEANGFEIVYDQDIVLVEKVKSELVNYMAEGKNLHFKMSSFLEERLDISYLRLNRLFSKKENCSIKSYYQRKRISKIKELLISDQHSLSQIAEEFNYSSVQALSQQFKSLVGVILSEFKSNIRKRQFLQIDYLKMNSYFQQS